MRAGRWPGIRQGLQTPFGRGEALPSPAAPGSSTAKTSKPSTGASEVRRDLSAPAAAPPRPSLLQPEHAGDSQPSIPFGRTGAAAAGSPVTPFGTAPESSPSAKPRTPFGQPPFGEGSASSAALRKALQTPFGGTGAAADSAVPAGQPTPFGGTSAAAPGVAGGLFGGGSGAPLFGETRPAAATAGGPETPFSAPFSGGRSPSAPPVFGGTPPPPNTPSSGLCGGRQITPPTGGFFSGNKPLYKIGDEVEVTDDVGSALFAEVSPLALWRQGQVVKVLDSAAMLGGGRAFTYLVKNIGYMERSWKRIRLNLARAHTGLAAGAGLAADAAPFGILSGPANKKPAAKKVAQEEQIVEAAPKVAVEKPVAEAPKKPAKPKWEIKDRLYYLIGRHTPLTLTIPGKHTRKHALLYFDEETGTQKEIRYATNHDSPFKSEQEGEATLGHIMFRDGDLRVPKTQQNLQKLLSLYHPLKGRIYEEYDPVEEAYDDLELLDLQTDAAVFARDMDIDDAEAILRVEMGNAVNQLSSKEIKRDLRLFANNNPALFLELAQDENVGLRNVAIKATEANIITLSQDQRTFSWTSNGRKLMSVPFDENPYSAMAAYFKTDEGVEVYRSIEKKFN